MHTPFKRLYIILAATWVFGLENPQTLWSRDMPFEQAYEGQVTFSNYRTPLWLNANKYGLSSLNRKNAYARVTLSYDKDSIWRNVDFKFCNDLVVPLLFYSQGYEEQYVSKLIVQQLYGDFSWHDIGLCLGIRQYPAQLRNNLLSSGAQTLGINARPIPQIRLYRDKWWDIPGLRHWASLKGHIAFGVTTDADWQETFTQGSGRPYNRWSRHHEKAGYLRIGNPEKFPLTYTAGLEMAAQFGGILYNYGGTDQNGYRGSKYVKLSNDFKSYWNALVPLGSADTDETKYQNSEGNQLGSWVLRLDWEREKYAVGIYFDHFFEDHSAMFQIDYDGYGEGAEWNEKKDFKYYSYPIKDFQLGIDLTLKEFGYVQGIVLEYMNNTYQSGPIYHDHNEGNSDHLGGVDDYYNHTTLPGWQHWGQAIGNPLFRSPQYNTDGLIYFEANRFRAWHFGINGSILPNLDYRVLYTWQKSWGTYVKPFERTMENTSILAELSYTFRRFQSVKAPKIKLGYGADKGRLLGNHSGFQFTIQYKLE